MIVFLPPISFASFPPIQSFDAYKLLCPIFVYIFLYHFISYHIVSVDMVKKRNYLNFVILDLSDQRDRYSGRISVPDGTLTFLIALPPFQGHKINQYIFLQYFNVLLTAFDYF